MQIFSKTLTPDQVRDIQQLLAEVVRGTPGIFTAFLAGFDGDVLATLELPENMDLRPIAELAVRLFREARLSAPHTKFISAPSQKGFLTVADYGGGYLVTIADEMSFAPPN